MLSPTRKLAVTFQHGLAPGDDAPNQFVAVDIETPLTRTGSGRISGGYSLSRQRESGSEHCGDAPKV